MWRQKEIIANSVVRNLTQYNDRAHTVVAKELTLREF